MTKTQPDFTRLLQQLADGALGPISRLQGELNMTLDQISHWIQHPHNRHVIANLVTLFDAQTQLMVCQHRLLAVAKLSEVIANATSAETVRRACKDLLSVRLINPYMEDERPEKPTPPPDLNTQDILDAMERLGEEAGVQSYGSSNGWDEPPRKVSKRRRNGGFSPPPEYAAFRVGPVYPARAQTNPSRAEMRAQTCAGASRKCKSSSKQDAQRAPPRGT